MTISFHECSICNEYNDKPLVCKKCLIKWKTLYGDSEKREAAEATAMKVKNLRHITSVKFPDNPLAKKFPL
ncbi:MAG: hypothetical protein LLF94_03205 [Chlamydiales bacterium]|nr:hypothetical protein [Chlamydiales bacterium]